MAEPTKNPADMSDEELNAIINGEDLEDKPDTPEQGKEPEAPEDVEDKEKEEPEEEEEAEEPEEEEPEDKPEDKPPSRREQLRINQILERIKNNEGGGQPQDEPSKTKQTPTGIKYEDELDADEETITRLNADRENYAEERYKEGLRQAEALKQQQDAFEFKQMLTGDEPRVLAKYSFMDSNSEDYQPKVAEAIVSKYFDIARFNPETKVAANPISYLEFVEAEVEFAQEIAARTIEESRENITKQAAQTGLRPSGSSPGKSLDLSKSPEDMSNEELDAFLESSGLGSKKRRI